MFGLYTAQHGTKDEHLFAEPSMAETYRGILKDHSLRRVNRIIENDTFEDSSSVYERMFLDCREEIRIVARGIKKEIFERPNVIAAAKRFLANETCRLVLELRAKDKEDAYKNTYTTEFFRAILDSASGTEKLKVNLYVEPKEHQFLADLPSVTFGDNRMYRKRTHQPGGDYSTHANADVNFNDPEMVNELRILIDDGLAKEQLMA